MIDCRQAHASPADSGGRGRSHFSYTRQHSSSVDTRHTDNDTVDSSHGCYMSLPIDSHKPVGWLLAAGLAKVTNTPHKHWQMILPVHTYTTSFFFPPGTDSVSPRTVLPHINEEIGNRYDRT